MQRRALLVEADSDLRRDLSLLLEGVGLAVDLATSAVDLVRLLAEDGLFAGAYLQ